jgi:hypothetical protein
MVGKLEIVGLYEYNDVYQVIDLILFGFKVVKPIVRSILKKINKSYVNI